MTRFGRLLHPLGNAHRGLASVPQGASDDSAGGSQRRQLSSDQLFNGLVETEILHGPFTYRLRQTSLGKLVLTK